MEILGQRPVWSMSGSEMLSTLDATYAEIARLETSALHLIAGLETTGHAQELGAGTTARLLTFRYRIDATKARRDVHLANALAKYPAVADALPHPDPDATTDEGGGAGSGVLLHPAQAEAIVSALDKVPTSVPVDDIQVAEREMVELGRTHGPLDLRKAGVQILHRLDTDGPEPTENKAYDREARRLKRSDNGVAFTGYLANENAELLRTLIHTYAKPHKTVDGALDPRSRDKRQADALTTILTTANNPTATSSVGESTTDTAAGAASAGANGFIPGHGPKAHITVTIDYNDLKTATADKTGHLIYGDALSAATIRRLACDAQILPIVLGSDSQPLDVGTTVRLATGPMRKALIARDRGCVCCGAPPIYCDAHHIKSWIDGGETKLTNLALLCKRCHRDLHAGHWNIHITNGLVHVTRPTWATPDPAPRGRYRPSTTTPHTPTPHPATPTPCTPTAGAPTVGAPTVGAPTVDSPTGRAATVGTPGTATRRASTRAWPRDTDPPWITAEDAARLNPWGDIADDRPPLSRDRRPDDVPNTPAGGRPPATGLDVWGETVSPNPTADRRRKPSAATTDTFDPWGDSVSDADDGNLGNESDDEDGDRDRDGDGDGDSEAERHATDPWCESIKPHGNSAAA